MESKLNITSNDDIKQYKEHRNANEVKYIYCAYPKSHITQLPKKIYTIYFYINI